MHIRQAGPRVAFIILGMVNAVVLSAQKKPGYTYDVVTTPHMTTMGPGTPMDSTPRRARVVTVGGNARMDYDRGMSDAGPFASAPGDYMLISGRMVRMISPSAKTITEMGPEIFGNGFSDLFRDMPVSFSLSDVSVKSDSIGAGGPLLGMPTEHWQTTVAFTLKLDAGGTSQSFTQRQVFDSWITRSMPPLFNPVQLAAITAIDTTGAKGPFSELMIKMSQAYRRLPNTFLLKHIATINMESSMGMAMASTITSEVANLKQASVDTSVFFVPSGYQVVKLADRMHQMMDSLKALAPNRKP